MKGSRIGRQPNAVKFHCAMEIRQLQAMRAFATTPTLSDPESSSSWMLQLGSVNTGNS
ncbi:unnamed protein product, partial [Protopolystoma xenopodis]